MARPALTAETERLSPSAAPPPQRSDASPLAPHATRTRRGLRCAWLVPLLLGTLCLPGQELVGQDLVGQELVGQELGGQELGGQDVAKQELAGQVTAPATPSADEIQFFESRIRPLLARRCFECHSRRTDSPDGGLRLDDRQALLRGGELGPAVVPGDPEASRLIRAVGYRDTNLQMPPDGKLPEAEIALLTEWVRRGAAFPEVPSPSDDAAEVPGGPTGADQRPDSSPRAVGSAAELWSLRPLSQHPLPSIAEPGWASRRVDWFVAAERERRGLGGSPEADRRTLIRRVSFDLLGLPPAPEQVAAFVADPRPDAYERLVERLLASPHYGERWGRHWLDVARYTDTTASWLQSTGQAWLYRDWVVRALNQDLAYDDFVHRQLATDLIPETGPEDHAALGFLGLSPTYWKELKLAPDVIKTVVAEEWEERIDAVGRSFLGLTLACARCHDHKFDPISMRDYYALAGVFASTRLADRPLIPEDQAAEVARARADVAKWDQQIKALEQRLAKASSGNEQDGQPFDRPALEAELEGLRQQRRQRIEGTPHYDLPLAHGVDEASLYVLANGPDQTKLEYRAGEARNVELQIRGNPATPGAEVPRGFPAVFGGGEPLTFQEGSGRRELALAITRQAGPLAARVIVNRVWTWHFGRGIVGTPSNFGVQGARPTHPELLDDLAARFVEQGWSLKWLHRELLLSATYRQASTHAERSHAVDPDNQWLWRMNRRRLELEPWRDSILRVAGQLDTRLGGPARPLDQPPLRRTLYAEVQRRDLNPLLQLYDFPPPTAHNPLRSRTTTPLQQLFVLNSPFFRQRARDLAARSAAEAGGGSRGSDPASRLEWLYGELFQRPPSPRERELALAFLDTGDGSPAEPQRWSELTQVLLGSNEFMYID